MSKECEEEAIVHGNVSIRTECAEHRTCYVALQYGRIVRKSGGSVGTSGAREDLGNAFTVEECDEADGLGDGKRACCCGRLQKSWT